LVRIGTSSATGGSNFSHRNLDHPPSDWTKVIDHREITGIDVGREKLQPGTAREEIACVEEKFSAGFQLFEGPGRQVVHLRHQDGDPNPKAISTSES
jgi:hypothetical protein